MSNRAMKLSPWWLAPPVYLATSVAVFYLAWRSWSAYGRVLGLGELFDPRMVYLVSGRQLLATLVVLVLMSAAVKKRLPILVLVAFGLSFFAGFLEVVYYSGLEPDKLDFRPVHPAAIANALGWTSAASALSAIATNLRLPQRSAVPAK